MSTTFRERLRLNALQHKEWKGPIFSEENILLALKEWLTDYKRDTDCCIKCDEVNQALNWLIEDSSFIPKTSRFHVTEEKAKP